MRQPTELYMEAKCLAIWPCMEKPAAGTGSPGVSPYHLGINRSKKNPRNGIVENSVSGIISSGICLRRPALHSSLFTLHSYLFPKCSTSRVMVAAVRGSTSSLKSKSL